MARTTGIQSEPLRIGIAGATGRMGREIATAAQSWAGVEIRGGLVRPGSPALDSDVAIPLFTDPVALSAVVDVVIDVSTAAATPGIVEGARQSGTPLVCGVTGLDGHGRATLESAATEIPVLYARNLSTGIAALLDLLPRLLAALPDADVEIVEMHHRGKKDAPSGTAEALAEVIVQARAELDGQRIVYGRQGVAPRQPSEIGMHSLRGGANSGEHTVLLATGGEEIRIGHRALSRRTFADGALRAAVWIVRQPPGLYAMADVL
ncbi:MAG: 4-hydroxy-tetrahydrodipicolinate reductase [Thermomicrobiales bacterium]|nr:4-hydroxy-tetrahydrodipicolinate reductase [Thermomicrobiales bacterium]